MYICELCGIVPAPGTPASSLVIETRRFAHPARKRAHYYPFAKDNYKDDPGGFGPQISREVRVCAACRRAAIQQDGVTRSNGSGR